MSILLDALKKSEQQRQLGQVPDIHSPSGAESSRAAGRPRWVTWSLVICIALILVWVGWQRFRQPESTPDPAMESAQVVSKPVAAQPEPADSATRADAIDIPADGNAAAQRTPVETLPADGNARQDAAAQPAARSPGSEPRKSQVNQSFTEFEAPPQVAAEPSQASAPEQEQASGGLQLSTAALTGPQDQSAGDAAASPSEPRATEPISYWELPQGVRDSLPDLHITVLVYAERPEDRFLLISGERMVEKDQYQGIVVLEEIRREGAVFLYRNYRFLVKG